MNGYNRLLHSLRRIFIVRLFKSALSDNGPVDSNSITSSAVSTSTPVHALPGSETNGFTFRTPEPTADSETSPISKYEVRSRIMKTCRNTVLWRRARTFRTGLDVYNEDGTSILSASFEPEDCPVYADMMDTMGCMSRSEL
jgi:hypothetical protein